MDKVILGGNISLSRCGPGGHHHPGKPPCKGEKPHHISGPAENCPRDAKNMPGHRDRGQDGTTRAKSRSTFVETLEKTEHIRFKSWVPKHDTLGMLIDIAAIKNGRGVKKIASAINKLPPEVYMARRNAWIQEHKGNGHVIILNVEA